MMYEEATGLIKAASRITVIQAENPDGDSLGSSLALEEILSDLGKKVTMYCLVDIPKYLRYMPGWDRVTSDFPASTDLHIIVDTSAEDLMTKTLNSQGIRSSLEHHPLLVIDHHASEAKLTVPHTLLAVSTAVSTGEVVFKLAQAAGWGINQTASEHLLATLMSDTLGFSTPSVTAEAFETAARLIAGGAHPSVVDSRRREYMKKSREILAYKGRLIGRIEYALEGRLATVHIPWEEIQSYSDQYNPSMLVMEEMMLVEGVDAAVAIKTYPDGKLTGKIRASIPVAERIAGYFGGGGHRYSAGFKVYEEYGVILNDVIKATGSIFDDYDREHPSA